MKDELVFQIGFNKCATTALFWLFVNSGVPALHSSGRRSRRAGHPLVGLRHPQLTIHQNICAGLPPVQGFEDFSAFFDMEYDTPKSEAKIENFKFFDRFAAAYPNARFILNTRDKSKWLRSRARHNSGQYLKRSMHRLDLSESQVLERWDAEFDRHNDAVQEFFIDEKDRLLVFEIDNDSIEKVISFCAPEYAIRLEEWGMLRVTDDVLAKKEEAAQKANTSS